MRIVPVSQRLPAGVSGRITSSNKLNPLQFDPSLVRSAVEPSVFHHLHRHEVTAKHFSLHRRDDWAQSKTIYLMMTTTRTCRMKEMTLCVPYLSMSGKLISSQNSTSHLPSWTGARTTPLGVRRYSQ